MLFLGKIRPSFSCCGWFLLGLSHPFPRAGPPSAVPCMRWALLHAAWERLRSELSTLQVRRAFLGLCPSEKPQSLPIHHVLNCILTKLLTPLLVTLTHRWDRCPEVLQVPHLAAGRASKKPRVDPCPTGNRLYHC